MGSKKSTNKPTLTQRLFLGYLIMVALTVFVGVYAIISLNELRQINKGIVEVDLPLIEASHAMIETLRAQDVYARKYAILKDNYTEALFWGRSAEFEQQLSNPAFIKGGYNHLRERLRQLHDEYNNIFKQELALTTLKKGSREFTESLSSSLQMNMDEQLRLLLQLEQQARDDQQQKLMLTNRRSEESWKVALIISLASLALGIGFASFAAYRISRSVQQLSEATRRIGQGEFDRLPTLETDYVTRSLGDSIRWMTKQLKEIGEMKLDANPLTQLPGTIAVERELIKRLRGQELFAFCYIDLKDFKAFGDRYGFSKGSEVIMLVSQILVEAVQIFGNPGDFVGHIGGDDFVLITEPQNIQTLSEKVIKEFDQTILSYYDEEDRERGYIISKDRKDNVDSFPIMTISIAVITNEQTHLREPSEVAVIAAQLKQYAKSLQRSAYVVHKGPQDDNSK
ncbi:MAG: diguanylate cyclase [Nitrospirota bacterium]|mgnify:CR=1 FL=1